jgi:hypothetical protein
MKSPSASDQPAPGNGSTTHEEPGEAGPQGFSPDQAQSRREEPLAISLRTAIAHRVNTTLERSSFDAVPRSAEMTPRWEPEQTASPTGHRAKTSRAKKIGLSVAAIVGVVTPVFALTRPTLFASKSTPTQVVQVASAESDQFAVKLFARDPDFKVSMFYSSLPMLDPNQQGGLHLSNGSVWIDVRLAPPQMAGLSPKSGQPVTLGGVSGELIEDSDSDLTTVRWTVDEKSIVGYGGLYGSAKAEVLVALGQIRVLNDKLLFERGTSKFSAVALEQDPNQYGVALTGIKNRAEQLNYSVQIDPSYAADYLANLKFIKRGNRTYYLLPASGGFSQVSFRFGTASVYVSGQVTQDRLLDFADTIREATPKEWEMVRERRFENEPTAEEIPSDNLLVDGQLDEDNRASANFELVVPPPDEQKQKDCVTVVFTVKEQNKTSCIDKNSTEQFRLLETFTADGVTVVYGVDAPDERDNHVVRVTDAAGDVVAEDVTLDQRNFSGRAFGLALPNDSVAPFTVELFDYDREWYQSGEELPDTYVRPGSRPLATAIVKP